MTSSTGTWTPISDDEAEFLSRLPIPVKLKLVFDYGEEIHDVDPLQRNKIPIRQSGKLLKIQLSGDDGQTWWDV